MKTKSCELSWIVVSDFAKAKKFYSEVLGLKTVCSEDEWGWAELEGHNGGSRIGLTKDNQHSPIRPGQNAVITLVVDNLEKAIDELKSKKVKLLGEIQEVPGHVKLQLLADDDGNYLQLVEKISG